MRSTVLRILGCAAFVNETADDMEKAVNLKQNFVETQDNEIETLILDSKAINTRKSTNTALTRLRNYLKIRELPELEDIDDVDLPQIIMKFYTDVRTTTKGEMYKTSSFKVVRAGLNRHFKAQRNIDIVADQRFMKAEFSI